MFVLSLYIIYKVIKNTYNNFINEDHIDIDHTNEDHIDIDQIDEDHINNYNLPTNIETISDNELMNIIQSIRDTTDLENMSLPTIRYIMIPTNRNQINADIENNHIHIVDNSIIYHTQSNQNSSTVNSKRAQIKYN